MICLNCDGENFKEEVQEVDQEVDGKTYTVTTEGMVCQNCGFMQMTSDQANKLYQAVKAQMKSEAGKK